jgi:hypothetical protein
MSDQAQILLFYVSRNDLRKVLPQFEFNGSKLPEGIRRDKNNVRRHSSAKAQGTKKDTCAFAAQVMQKEMQVGGVNSNWSIRDFFFMSKKGIV